MERERTGRGRERKNNQIKNTIKYTSIRYNYMYTYTQLIPTQPNEFITHMLVILQWNLNWLSQQHYYHCKNKFQNHSMTH